MIEPKTNLENFIPEQPEKTIASTKWEMKLDDNENYIGPSTKVLHALKNTPPEVIARFPETSDLQVKLAAYCDVYKENILVTNGENAAYKTIFSTYLHYKDKALVVGMDNYSIRNYAAIEGIQLIEMSKVDFDDLLNIKDESVKAVIVRTPDEFWGQAMSKDEITQLVERYPDKLVIIDEMYADFIDTTAIDLVSEHDNLFVIKSFDVGYGLAGLKVGYVVSDEVNIYNLHKLADFGAISSLSLLAASTAIDDRKYIGYVRNELLKAKNFLADELYNMGFTVNPSVTNFITVDFAGKKALLYKKLLDCNVLVKQFKRPELGSCLRITLPTLSAAKRLVGHLRTKDTIVFDMDGVLINVRSSYIETVIQTYKHFTGRVLTPDKIAEEMLQSHIDDYFQFAEYFVNKSGFNFPTNTIAKVFNKIYWDSGEGLINSEELLVDKVLLKELADKYNLAVFTERNAEETSYSLEKFGIKQLFGKIVTGDDVPLERRKPHATGLHIVKESFFTDRIIYAGDSAEDIKCAKKFGAFSVGVLPPENKSPEYAAYLNSLGAEFIVNSVNDINSVLAEINNIARV